MFTDFDLNEREHDGDTLLRQLFAEWRRVKEELRVALPDRDNDELSDDLCEVLDGIEERMRSTRATGPFGMAVKLFVESCFDNCGGAGDPLALRAFDHERRREYHYNDAGRLYDQDRWLCSLLADAAVFAPELAPLVAEIVASPLELRSRVAEQPALPRPEDACHVPDDAAHIARPSGCRSLAAMHLELLAVDRETSEIYGRIDALTLHRAPCVDCCGVSCKDEEAIEKAIDALTSWQNAQPVDVVAERIRASLERWEAERLQRASVAARA